MGGGWQNRQHFGLARVHFAKCRAALRPALDTLRSYSPTILGFLQAAAAAGAAGAAGAAAGAAVFKYAVRGQRKPPRKPASRSKKTAAPTLTTFQGCPKPAGSAGSKQRSSRAREHAIQTLRTRRTGPCRTVPSTLRKQASRKHVNKHRGTARRRAHAANSAIFARTTRRQQAPSGAIFAGSQARPRTRLLACSSTGASVSWSSVWY